MVTFNRIQAALLVCLKFFAKYEELVLPVKKKVWRRSCLNYLLVNMFSKIVGFGNFFFFYVLQNYKKSRLPTKRRCAIGSGGRTGGQIGEKNNY